MFWLPLGLLAGLTSPVPAQAPTIDCDTQYEALGASKSHEFYARNDQIEVGGIKYEKFGLPRYVGARQAKFVGDYRGVPLAIYNEHYDDNFIHLMLAEGPCTFQPYRKENPVFDDRYDEEGYFIG